ncbi:hypothetical protein CALCODRAFT_321529 [Calocera cornea HHB12733]|uniref:Uncharacterized protein n=1 Tax=Calocera cornea HHB12733 TaxID=1353952 RepID=A0A165F690_9BASI|nr:hypothetical protein CALCODRAFT_321529 [Calocera cornea HHB12733]
MVAQSNAQSNSGSPGWTDSLRDIAPRPAGTIGRRAKVCAWAAGVRSLPVLPRALRTLDVIGSSCALGLTRDGVPVSQSLTRTEHYCILKVPRIGPPSRSHDADRDRDILNAHSHSRAPNATLCLDRLAGLWPVCAPVGGCPPCRTKIFCDIPAHIGGHVTPPSTLVHLSPLPAGVSPRYAHTLSPPDHHHLTNRLTYTLSVRYHLDQEWEIAQCRPPPPLLRASPSPRT